VDRGKLINHKIKNGENLESVLIPESNMFEIIKQKNIPLLNNPNQLILDALNNPIGTEPLETLIKGKNKIVIISDDLTRPTPVCDILPHLLKKIESVGIKSDQITILIATGTHRAMSPTELDLKLGTFVTSKYNIVNHDYRDLENIIDLGKTKSGIPIKINRLVMESDFVIGIGNIVPHRYCGWAGGAKIIQPGVSGEDTTAATHLMITVDPKAYLGSLENDVRHEIELVAEKANLKFIVNSILNDKQQLVGVVAGDMRKAFREGVNMAEGFCGATFTEKVDVVIASAYPSDLNLWQAGKAFYSADLIVKSGGIIILVSPCLEGIGEHGTFSELMFQDYDSIKNLLDENKIKDRISAAAALAVALVRQRAKLWLVCKGVTDLEAQKMGCRLFSDVQSAVDAALEINSDLKISILPNACEVLPLKVKIS
jgi:nickel-dependent lactate racemase